MEEEHRPQYLFRLLQHLQPRKVWLALTLLVETALEKLLHLFHGQLLIRFEAENFRAADGKGLAWLPHVIESPQGERFGDPGLTRDVLRDGLDLPNSAALS